MNMEKIETAFGLLLANVQQLKIRLATHFYDALIEQNVSYLGKAVSEDLAATQRRLRALNLIKQECAKGLSVCLD